MVHGAVLSALMELSQVAEPLKPTCFPDMSYFSGSYQPTSLSERVPVTYWWSITSSGSLRLSEESIKQYKS